MAASAIICVTDETYNTVCEKFIDKSKKVIVANPLKLEVANEPMVMGPVISSAAKERISSLIEEGIKEGANLALDGREIVVKGCEKGYFIGPTVFTDVKPGMKIHRTEIFGPVGINIGIPAPVAYLPFGGMKASQFADIKAQGKAIINFFTEDKIITERYWSEEENHDK